MKHLAAIGIGLVCLIGASGCQCCALFDCYADVIDHVSESSPRFDCLYHPSLDLNRIGKPDWCQCPVNRLLCHRACRRLWVDPHRYLPAVGHGHYGPPVGYGYGAPGGAVHVGPHPPAPPWDGVHPGGTGDGEAGEGVPISAAAGVASLGVVR